MTKVKIDFTKLLGYRISANAAQNGAMLGNKVAALGSKGVADGSKL